MIALRTNHNTIASLPTHAKTIASPNQDNAITFSVMDIRAIACYVKNKCDRPYKKEPRTISALRLQLQQERSPILLHLSNRVSENQIHTKRDYLFWQKLPNFVILILVVKLTDVLSHISHKSLEDRDMELKVVVEVLDET